MSWEDTVPAQSRKGEIQLTDILDAEEYKAAKFVFPPLYDNHSRKVYKIVNGKDICVLKLADTDSLNVELLKGFSDECKRGWLLGLECPHFVKVKGIRGFKGEASNRTEILMEYGGENLLKLARTATKEEMTMFVLQSVIALRYCEARRICHLDIKPSNMVFRDGILRIIDLGIAIEFELRGEVSVPLGEKYKSKLYGWTNLYAPPECLKLSKNDIASKYIGSKVDVYCWGITFYTLLCGISEYDVIKLKEDRKKATEKEYNEGFLAELKARKELREFNPKVNMAEIIAACLCYIPEKRCSFEQLEQLLEPVSDSAYSNDQDAAEIYILIGQRYSEQLGNEKAALRYLQKSLDINIKLKLDVAKSYRAIGNAYRRAYKKQTALDYLMKALAIQQKRPEHLDIADTYKALGSLYADFADAQKSLEYYLKALAITEKVLGLEHKKTASLCSSIGYIYFKLGDFNNAKEFLLRALQVQEKHPKELNEQIITTYAKLGLVYQQFGDYKTALVYHQKMAIISEDALGVENLRNVSVYHELGNDYNKMGDSKRSLEYHLKALDIAEKTLGANNLLTAASYNNVGGAYISQGNNQKALDYFSGALRVYESFLGTEHPETARVYHNMGEVYRVTDNNAKALEYHTKAMKVFEKTLGPKHPETVDSCKCIGIDLLEVNQPEQALPNLFKALNIEENFIGAKHVKTALTYERIGYAYQLEGKRDESFKYFQKAIDLREKLLGSMHPLTVDAHSSLGYAYYHFGNYEESLKCHLRVLNIRRKMLGPQHSETLVLYVMVIKECMKILYNDSAEHYFERMKNAIDAVPEQKK
ncbi:MAG: tetratricopeptide repeat-containing serine/threonine-protein kinase [Desulfosporosinus sp.]|nr:tetratricopeptide repeat-containing serine/threonine-protein kinase [Desulfosporosinus sp.]